LSVEAAVAAAPASAVLAPEAVIAGRTDSVPSLAASAASDDDAIAELTAVLADVGCASST
jgi:hypothetical protein